MIQQKLDYFEEFEANMQNRPTIAMYIKMLTEFQINFPSPALLNGLLLFLFLAPY